MDINHKVELLGIAVKIIEAEGCYNGDFYLQKLNSIYYNLVHSLYTENDFVASRELIEEKE